MLKPLLNEEFFIEAIERIADARRSIAVIHYLAELRSGAKCEHVRLLGQKLIAARRRGVSVEVILEGANLSDNYPFYRLLKDGVVDVWLDTSKTYIHQKSILIDGRCLIAGSHNLSEKSLSRNIEYSFATDDRKAAQAFGRQWKLVTGQRKEIRKAKNTAGFTMPQSLMVTDEKAGISGALLHLKSATAPYLFNLYLFLCYLDRGRPKEIAIDFEKLGRAAGLDPKRSRTKRDSNYAKYFWQNRVSQILALMCKKYGLIDVDLSKRTIKRRALASARGRIFVPDALFEMGWLTRLSLHAKYFWFAGQLEKEISPFKPWWSLSYREILAKYGFTLSTIKRAKNELKAFSLLEVLEDKPQRGKSGFYQEPNFYRHNPFYDTRG